MTFEGRARISDAERRDVLHREISRYVSKGWVVSEQTDWTVSLTRKKRFSFWWALLWFLLAVVGLVVYIIYYLAKHDESLYLTVDEFGYVEATKS